MIKVKELIKNKNAFLQVVKEWFSNYRIQISFVSILLISILPFIFKFLGINDRFSSIPCTIITSILLIFCYLINFKLISNKDTLLIVLVNIVSLIVTLLLEGALGVITIYVNMLLMLFLFNNLKFPKLYCLWVHAIQAIAILLWLQTLDTTYIWRAYVTEPSGLYVNPCTVAIMALASFYHIFICVTSFEIDNKYVKVLFWALTIYAFAKTYLLILDSGCRASLLALLLFCISFALKDKIASKYSFCIKAAVIFCLTFPLIYIGLSLMVGNFEFFGKGFFTQRDNVWQSVYELIYKSPIIGVGSENDILLMGHLMDDAHNLFLGIWKNIGLIPMFTLGLMFSQGKNIDDVTPLNRVAKMAFLTAFFISTVETVLNGNEYYIFYFTLLLTMEKDLDTNFGNNMLRSLTSDGN